MSKTSLKKAPRFIKRLNKKACEFYNLPKDTDVINWYADDDTMEFGIGCTNSIEQIHQHLPANQCHEVDTSEEGKKLAEKVIEWLREDSDVKSARIDIPVMSRVLAKMRWWVIFKELFFRFIFGFLSMFGFFGWLYRKSYMCWFDNGDKW
jgi:hypothetical protein